MTAIAVIPIKRTTWLLESETEGQWMPQMYFTTRAEAVRRIGDMIDGLHDQGIAFDSVREDDTWTWTDTRNGTRIVKWRIRRVVITEQTA